MVTGDVDMGYSVGEVELFAILGGLWFGETRSRKRALEKEGKVHHHWEGTQESLLFIHLVETQTEQVCIS